MDLKVCFIRIKNSRTCRERIADLHQQGCGF